jgi:hypothetical protein
VLQIPQASRIEPPCQLVDGPDSGQHLHRSLDGAAADRANFGSLVDGSQRGLPSGAIKPCPPLVQRRVP